MAEMGSAPSHLSADAKRWWLSVVDGWEIDNHGVRLVTLAAEAWDRGVQARKLLAKEGITYHDRFGAPRKHPCISIEENARIAFARLVRELNLEADEPDESRVLRIGGRK